MLGLTVPFGVTSTPLAVDSLSQSKPSVFTVAITRFAGDDDQNTSRERLIHELTSNEMKGWTVRRAEVMPLSSRPFDIRARERAHDVAQKAILENGQHMAVWGFVEQNQVQLFRSMPDKEDADRQWRFLGAYASNPSEATEVWEQVKTTLALAVLTEATKFIEFREKARTEELRELIERAKALQHGSRSEQAREAAFRALADAQLLLGELSNDPQMLQAAYAAYSALLARLEATRPDAQYLVMRGTLKNRMGTAKRLMARGGPQVCRDCFEQAEVHYLESLDDLRQEEGRREWARTQNDLGLTKRNAAESLVVDNEAQKMERENLLRDALKHFDHALSVRGKADDLQVLASATATNRLETRRIIANHRAREKSNAPREDIVSELSAIVREHEQLLSIRRFDLYPLYWSTTKFYIGRTLLELDEIEPQHDHLLKAISALEDSLKGRTERGALAAYLGSQRTLGKALLRLSKREADSKAASSAIDAFRRSVPEGMKGRNFNDWFDGSLDLALAFRLRHQLSGTTAVGDDLKKSNQILDDLQAEASRQPCNAAWIKKVEQARKLL